MAGLSGGAAALASPLAQGHTLRTAAAATGRIAACFTTTNSLRTDPRAEAIFPVDFAMLADGADMKTDILRPTPTTFDFGPGDYALSWARTHGLLLRGHTLVWHAALPSWFNSYINRGNARQWMTEHITTVMRHYAGQIYSWDVVNEMIHNAEGRPDGLRPKPWLELVGPDYIEIALRTAAAADPKARLVINENTLEHDLPNHAQRRDSLLNLCKTLKSRNAPLHAVGLQSHVKGGVPFAASGLREMLSQMRGMGLEIYITELDVDDTLLPANNLDQEVAQVYAQYLGIVGPFAKMICFEQLADRGDPAYGQIERRRPDGLAHRPNPFDFRYNRKPAYTAVVETLLGLPRI
jgi:endo-1,4-beta-xylanase